MKVLQINSVYGVGSTGKIVKDISTIVEKKGYSSYVAYGYGDINNNKNIYRMQGNLYLKYNITKTRILGKHGFYNKIATKRMIKWIEDINPDIIHIHNIHGHYINIKILFEYIKKKNIPVIWTLHDCWSFTGHCAHFDYIGCERWKTECLNCKQLNTYPKTLFFDRSKESFREKGIIFNGVNNLTIVTPSKWLSNLVEKSFLNNYDIKVINNGIDLNIFRPTKNDFKKNYGLENKNIILGVASGFETRKGYKYFLELAKRLNDKYIIVLVGINKEQQNTLPKNIIGILRTNNQEELADIYSSADVFINPTLEDNFPTTNIEALACGTPVVTFNTGGSPEIISDDTGMIVNKGDIDSLYYATLNIIKNGKAKYTDNCIDRANKFYCKNNKFNEYIQLYERVKK